MPDPLRVLVVTTALVPDQMQTWRQAAELDGVDLHLAGALVSDRSESYLADLAVPEWGTAHVLEPAGWVGRGRLWWTLDGLEELIGSLAPDAVHVHSEVWGRLVGQAVATGAPVVAHGAENVSLEHGGRLEARVRTRIARRNAARLAGYASWNRAGVEILRENGLRPGAPTAVAPAIVPDPTPFLAIDAEKGRSGRVRIGYVGRLVPEKGVQWLVDAMVDLDGAELVVIGDGSYQPELVAQARRRDLDVQWASSVSAGEVAEAYADLDVVVVPSLARPGWAEQFGRVVCEAMFAGVPVIASDSGSLGEVVGDGGIVVPELDRAALRAAIAGLVADEGARRRLGAAGRRWALAELGPEPAARRLRRLWLDVAAA